MSQPEIVFKHGSCQAAVFTKEMTRDGRAFQVRSVSFQKRFRDKNGDWQTSSYLNIDEIPKAVLCLQKAYDFMTAGNSRNGEKEE